MDCLGASPFHKQGIAKRQVLKTCLYTNTPNRLQWISKAKRSSMTIDGKLITVAPLTSACLLNCLQVSLHVQSQCYSVMAPNYASLQQRNLQLLDCELTATWPSARCCDACSLSLARPEKQMLRSELLPRIRFKKKTPTMTRVMPGPKEEKKHMKNMNTAQTMASKCAFSAACCLRLSFKMHSEWQNVVLLWCVIWNNYFLHAIWPAIGGRGKLLLASESNLTRGKKEWCAMISMRIWSDHDDMEQHPSSRHSEFDEPMPSKCRGETPVFHCHPHPSFQANLFLTLAALIEGGYSYLEL